MSEEPVIITACILARNEEHRIEDALKSLQGWTDQILVIDNESEDATVAVARRYTQEILSTPRKANFDAARNQAIDRAIGNWIFYLDADERVPPRLGPELRQLVQKEGDQFEALVIPFRHYFCGKWIQHCNWWPGYTRPQLLKKGTFHYNERLHHGIEVQGRTRLFPADDPELAIVHYSYDDLHHYLTKLNHYTDGEAENLYADSHSHSWQAMLAHFVADWQIYYERGQAPRDGMHGFVLSFMSAFYRFAARAKLWDMRRQRGEISDVEPLPTSLREMLEFMAQISQEGAQPWLQPAAKQTQHVPLIWSAPLLDSSGYADEARNFVLGLVEAGEPVHVAPLTWGAEDIGLDPKVHALLEEHTVAANDSTDVLIMQTLPRLYRPSANARVNVLRTMYETDRLPPGLAQDLNMADRVWVPSEFNRETFMRSGVDPHRIAVIPGALDAERFAASVESWPVPGHEPFRFLSVFDWTLHKGWDVLLESFAREFAARQDVGLVLKVWSTTGYSLQEIQAQADALLRERVGKSLTEFPNIHIWQERIPGNEMPRLYRAVQAYVAPTRGEGWCRPLMEAMAAGLPTIATAWSGLTAFHDEKVGYPLKYRVEPVSESGAREVPIYAGQCWAEPDLADLRRLLRYVVRYHGAARKRGQAAQERIKDRFSRAAVTRLVQEELALCRKRADAAPRHAENNITSGHQAPAVSVTAPGSRSLPSQRPAALPIRPNANPVPNDPARPVDFCSLLGRPLRLQWRGDLTPVSSLAYVNREFCHQFIADDDIELSILETEHPWGTLPPQDSQRLQILLARRDACLSGPADITIRHHFPPDWRRPKSGKLIVMQPWEYGHLPKEWVHAAIHDADEVWAYSRFVRDVYVRSGVPAEKVRVVPLGVCAEIFTPQGPHYPLPTQKSIRFLFVGGAIDRKGADLLLSAYRNAFTAHDDVCLVVKSMGERTFYARQTYAEAFRRAAADPSGPEVIYFDEDLSESTMAALYRACTCVVLPYRGEGFGLSPLEGMACGRAAIVTAGGPTEDYLDDNTALRVPYHRRAAGKMNVGPFLCVGDPWQLEPDLGALVDALRWVRDHPEETQARGEAARQQVEMGWTWKHAAEKARVRLGHLVASVASHQTQKAVAWAEPGESAPDKHTKKRAKAKPALDRVDLSLCMIARNEEARIAQGLKSIAPYVDEMVVVDTGSTDRTREIARDCGARVFDYAWTDSFADARNQSLEQALGAWIFWMDADDVITEECGRQLRELTRKHPQRDAAYQVHVRIPPGPGEFSESLVDHVKLFPNRPDLRFEHRIHEQILPSLRRAGIEIHYSDLYVTHKNYDRSPEGQAHKRQRDFHLLYLDLADHPDHPFVLFNLGMTHLYATREYEVASQYLQRSLDRSHWRDSIVRKAYALLTTARICQQDWQAAQQANEAGRHYYPDDAELLFQAGQIYQQVGRFDIARQALERLVTGQEDIHYRSVDAGLRTYRGWHELALLYRRLGDASHCAQVLHQIVTRNPDYLPARLDLADTYYVLGQPSAAQAVLVQTQPVAEREQVPHASREEPLMIALVDTGKGGVDANSEHSNHLPQPYKGLQQLASLFPFPMQKPFVPSSKLGELSAAVMEKFSKQFNSEKQIVVEIGPTTGCGTRQILSCAPQATIIVLDDWGGTHLAAQHKEWSQVVPVLYETFIVNCWELKDRIIPIRQNPLQGLDLLVHLGIEPEGILLHWNGDAEEMRRRIMETVSLFPMAFILGDAENAAFFARTTQQAIAGLQIGRRLCYTDDAWWLERSASKQL